MLAQVIDYATISTNQIDTYCITAGGGPLKVTLVWADYPADTSAAISLVNDLDLLVAANSLNGYAQHGNGEVDRRNNVEQVSLCPFTLHLSSTMSLHPSACCLTQIDTAAQWTGTCVADCILLML